MPLQQIMVKIAIQLSFSRKIDIYDLKENIIQSSKKIHWVLVFGCGNIQCK